MQANATALKHYYQINVLLWYFFPVLKPSATNDSNKMTTSAFRIINLAHLFKLQISLTRR